MSWRQDHHRARVAGENILECMQQERFFALHRTPAHEHWTRMGLFECLAHPDDEFWSYGQRYIKFQVSAHLNSITRRPNAFESLRVLSGLCQEEINRRED